MAGINRNTGKATDLITFSRASGGTALRKISYGSELVTNGTFDADLTGWSVTNANVSNVIEQSAGVLSMTRVVASFEVMQAEQTVTGFAGKVVRLSCDYTEQTNTNGRLQIYGSPYFAVTFECVPGYNEFVYFIPVGTTSFIVRALHAGGGTITYPSTVTFDNISVKEVLFDQPDGTLTLFNHPAGIPRIDYDADGTVKGLLIEEQRTNSLPYSEDFTEWTDNQSSVVKNNAIAPDKTTTADAIVKTNAVNIFWSIRETFIFSTNTTYTLSVFAKAIDANYLMLRQLGESNGRTWFDLSTGTIGTQQSDIDSASIEEYGSGWYRCSITFTTGSSISNNLVDISFFQADNSTLSAEGVSGYVWGAQLEQGSFPTSYIPTSGATATRAADVASISVDSFGYNQSEGTVVVEWNQPVGAASYISMLSDGTAANRSFVRQFADGKVYFSTVTNNVAQGDILAGTSVDGSNDKVAFVMSSNDAGASLNGASVVTDLTYEVPSSTDLSIGSYSIVGVQYLNGHIKSLAYYPRRLTNDQLVELTS